MTGGYTILDLGGNEFTVGETKEEAEGKKVEGIYDRIERNNFKKPFLLENYSFSRGEDSRARFVGFSEVVGGFEAAFYASPDPTAMNTGVVPCIVRVGDDDTVKFFKA